MHEQGSGYGGGGTNFIDADVVFKLDSRPDKAFGFYLRNDDNQPIRQGMLDLVRDAMTHGLKVTTDFTELVMPPNQNSFVLRVSLTKLPEPGRHCRSSLNRPSHCTRNSVPVNQSDRFVAKSPQPRRRPSAARS